MTSFEARLDRLQKVLPPPPDPRPSMRHISRAEAIEYGALLGELAWDDEYDLEDPRFLCVVELAERVLDVTALEAVERRRRQRSADTRRKRV